MIKDLYCGLPHQSARLENDEDLREWAESYGLMVDMKPLGYPCIGYGITPHGVQPLARFVCQNDVAEMVAVLPAALMEVERLRKLEAACIKVLDYRTREAALEEIMQIMTPLLTGHAPDPPKEPTP